jgi:hypothetical protein
MSVVLTKYRSKITASIRAAQRHGAVTEREADCLCSMAINSFPAASTTALIHGEGAPDYLYASLYFATLVWQSGDAEKRKTQAKAGQKLARFILSQDTPAHDACWVANLLREFYDAHQESSQGTIARVAWQTAPANCC